MWLKALIRIPDISSLSSESLAYAEHSEDSAEAPADTALETPASSSVLGDLLGANNFSLVSVSVSEIKTKLQSLLINGCF